MLEAQIEIEDKLAAKGFKRAMQGKAIADIAGFYANYLVIFWIVIAVADGLMDAGHLIFPHLLVIVGIWIIATTYSYLDWSKKIAQTKGWSFHAKLDEQGVIVTRSDTERLNWNFYKNYKEFDDYLQIECTNGSFTFVPKTPELFAVVEYTKEKIPRQ